MLMPNLDTYFLEVSAHASLKVATENSYTGKKIQKLSILKFFFLKKKRKNATKKIEVSLINLPSLYLVQSHIFGSRCKRFTESSHQRFF